MVLSRSLCVRAARRDTGVYIVVLVVRGGGVLGVLGDLVEDACTVILR